MDAVLAVVFWVSAGLLVYAQAGYAVLLVALARARAAPRPARRRGARPVGLADRGRVRRGGGDQGEGRERAGARLPARAARGHRRVRRLARRDRASGRARPAPTSCSSCRAAARSAPRTPRSSGRAASVVAFSDANALWEPDALRALVAPFADPRVGYVCGQVRFVNDGGHQPGGPLLALRDGAARARVAAGLGHRRQRRDLRDPPRVDYLVVDPIMGHDLSFPFNMVKRGCRAVYAPKARAIEQMVPDDRGRVRPQAADDEPRVADRPARRPALPARLSAALRADDLLAPRAALRRAVPARSPRS